jgi:hypothetical protein
VTVTPPDGGEHRGVVVSLRHRWDDAESISVGDHLEFGMILEPSYLGSVPARVTG